MAILPLDGVGQVGDAADRVGVEKGWWCWYEVEAEANKFSYFRNLISPHRSMEL